MAIGRKGAVFTLMAILVSVLIISLFSPDDSSRTTIIDTVAASTRVSLMNAFITTIQQHASQSLATSGYFALTRITEKIGEEDAFIPLNQMNQTFFDCIGQNEIMIGGSPEQCLDPTRTVAHSLDRLVQLANEELAISMTYRVEDAWIEEESPMELILVMELSYNVSDAFARWEVENDVLRVPLDVQGVPDPVYVWLNATGATGELRNFSLSRFRPGQFNLEVFDQFYDNQSYVIWQRASPSVLKRFVGDMNPSNCCGIQSVVRVSNLTNPPPIYQNYSLVDHHLVEHLRGTRAEYDCTIDEVSKLARDGPFGTLYLGMHWFSFDNPYNLSGYSNEPECSWSWP